MSTRERRPDLHSDLPFDLLRPATLKALCERAGIRPDRKSGQNFLVNRVTLERIVAAVDPQSGDTILEVGAGFGVLTLALAERMNVLDLRAQRVDEPSGSRAASVAVELCSLRMRGRAGVELLRNESTAARARSEQASSVEGGGPRGNREVPPAIIAIERDQRIIPILRELVEPYGDVEVVEGDALRLLRTLEQENNGQTVEQKNHRTIGQLEQYAVGILKSYSPTVRQFNWKLVANLPYSITSDFLRLLFDAIGTGALPPPERAVLLLQREVVDRLTADPQQPRDRRQVGMLTMLAALHCASRRIARVPPAHFWPAPKVESAVVVMEGWRTPGEVIALLGGVPRDDVLRFVRHAFAGRRQQLQRRIRSFGEDRVARALRAAGVAPAARPETLALDQWIALAMAFHGSSGRGTPNR